MLPWSSSFQSHVSDANFKKSLIKTCIDGLALSNMQLDPLTQAQSAEDSRSTAMEYYDRLDINMQSKMRFIWRL